MTEKQCSILAVKTPPYNLAPIVKWSSAAIPTTSRWSLLQKLKFTDPLSKQVFSGDALSFDAEAGLGDGDRRSLALDHLKYELMAGEETALTIGMTRKPNSKSEYEVDADSYGLTRKRGRGWAPGAPVQFYGFPDEVVAYHQNADFVKDLNLQHQLLFRSLHYLGPLRTRAERLYSWTGNEPEGVGYAGENTIAAILASRDRCISLKKYGRKKPVEEIIALKLKQMGLIEEFKVTPISEQRQEYEVGVRTKGSRDWVDLPDVGFGISQVLPVVVQCFYARPGSIVFVEQPEIHLHPRAQSALADVMIEVINSREDGSNRNIQLIIETHSEHFLRRLQRRIAEGKVLKKKVSAYFANVSRTPATLDALQLDECGNILNWPEHFFGDEMGDIAGQAKAALKRRKENSLSSESGT